MEHRILASHWRLWRPINCASTSTALRPRPLSSRAAFVRPQQPLNTALKQYTRRHSRCIHTSSAMASPSQPPKSRDRGPKSTETTQTDFAEMDVLRNIAAPATNIDACTSDGFALDNQLRINGSGIMLVAGEAFRWWPWTKGGHNPEPSSLTGKLTNSKGQWEVPKEAWGILELVWPKPDLLIIGTGPHVMPIAPSTRHHINSLGIRLEVQDTRNAASQFNLLATERGVQQVAAALIPMGWKEVR